MTGGRWRRRLLMAGAVLIGLLIVLAVAGWGVSRSAWGRGEIRQAIEAQAANALDGTLRLGGVEGSLFNGVTLTGVTFNHAGRDVFVAKVIEAKFSLWAWLRGSREISSIRVIDPVIELIVRHNEFDAGNWIRVRPDTGGPPTIVRLPAIEIVNGRLVTSANEGVWRLPAEIRELNGTIGLRVGGGTRVDISQLSFVSGAGATAFRARSTAGALTFVNGTKIEHLRLASDTGALTVDGQVGPTAPRAINLNLTLERFDAARWRPFTSLLDTIDLTANGTATLGGNVDRLAIQSQLTTSAGNLSGHTLVESIQSHLRITGDTQLTNVDARHMTLDPQWASALTGHVIYTVTSSGTPTAWAADVTLNGGPMKAFGAFADRIDGRVRYAAGTVTFDTTATAYGASTEASGTIVVGHDMTVDVRGQRLTNLDPRKLPSNWGFAPLDADINASAFVAHWTTGHWTVDAMLNASTIEGMSLAGGTMVLSSDPGAVSVAAEGTIAGLDARRLGRATGLTGLDSPTFVTDLNGHITLSGRGRDWSSIDMTAEADLLNSRAAAGARIASAHVTYARKSRGNTAHIVGGLAGLHPEALGAPAALASDINGQADITFEWRDDAADIAGSTVARGTLRAGASTIAALPITGGLVTGEWRDGAFTAETIELRNTGVTLRARGRLAVTRGESQATFDVAATDLGVLQPWSGRAARGAATGQGQLLGAFDAPHAIVSFNGARMSDPSLGVFESLTGTLDVVFPEWYLDRMTGDLQIQAAAWGDEVTMRATAVTAQGHFATRMHASAAQFQATARDSVIRGSFSSADWEKEVTADFATLEARHGARIWRLEPTSTLLQVTATHVTARNVQLLSDTGGRLSINGRMALAELETGGDATDQLSMRATSIDLAAFEEFFGLTTGARGQLSGDATFVGRLSDPRGRITITGRDLTVSGYLISEAGGSVELADGAAVTALTVKQPDGVMLTVNGRAPLSWLLPAGTLDPAVPSPSWDLLALSDPINLSILGSVSPSVTDLGGQAIVDLHIVGASATPTVTGTVAIADGRFKLPSAGTAFSNVTADIGFGLDKVTVRRFVARDKRDHLLKITGELAINERQVKGVDVHVEADRFTVVDNAIGAIELSSLLQLNGDFTHPRLSGNVEVASGRVEVDRLLRALQGDALAFVAETDLPAEGITPVDLRAAAAAAAAEEAARPASSGIFDSQTFFSSLAVDVQIFAPDNVIVRGSKLRPGGKNSWSLGDLNVTVGGELQATRDPGGVTRLNGDVTTIRGVYSFEGRRFEIQRGGRIRFQGESPLDPTFDIRGVRSIQGVEARVDVRGRLSEPQLRLGSNVPLDEADVLSMIIFNRPVNQLGDTQRADLVGAAASLAGGYVTSPLAQSLSRALDLDLLEVETVSFGQNVAPRVRVGQQLTSRLFVQLSQQFGAQSLSELTAEYKLAKFLRLQGSTAQGPGSRAQRSLLQRVERAGLDLLFFFNY